MDCVSYHGKKGCDRLRTFNIHTLNKSNPSQERRPQGGDSITFGELEFTFPTAFPNRILSLPGILLTICLLLSNMGKNGYLILETVKIGKILPNE
jgi:hypothetical protein